MRVINYFYYCYFADKIIVHLGVLMFYLLYVGQVLQNPLFKKHVGK